MSLILISMIGGEKSKISELERVDLISFFAQLFQKKMLFFQKIFIKKRMKSH